MYQNAPVDIVINVKTKVNHVKVGKMVTKWSGEDGRHLCFGYLLCEQLGGWFELSED